MQFKDYNNFHQMLCETVEKYANAPAYRWFDADANASSLTWKQFYDQVKAAAKSLMALDMQKGDKVNILGYTCYKWVLTDVANMSMGLGTVGIYQSNLAVDCDYIINHSDATLIFAENQTQLDKVLSIRDHLPNIKKVILFEGRHPGDDWVITYDEFLALGKDIDDAVFEKRTKQVTPEDTAGLVYTSGTTGVPKGVVLTHDNITYTCQSVYQSGQFYDGEEMFVFLPLAHVFARTCCYTAIKTGNRTTFARSIDSLLEDFKLASPHWFVSVPRVFEKIHTKIISGAQAKGGAALKIFNWACSVGAQVSDLKVKKEPIPMMLGLKYTLATKLVFSKIHAALGGNVKWCISGAAPLNPEIAKFFHAAGLLILEGIGMTENTSFSNVNRQDDYDFGVVGPPGVGTFHKIDKDGEVLFKGRNVMKEYYKMPKETAETFTDDGWLRSGDLGMIDGNDVLKITGRKKDLIITAGGKNIAPSRIEGIMITSKYINQFCVIGDQRKYLSAIASLDEENIKAFAAENKISFSDYSELLRHPDIQALIEKEVAIRNKELPSFETIKKVKIVPEFTIENNMMTPTFKLKKNIILKTYENDIQSMY
ncbi:MAG: long-chain fatty acid--CoA ligase [Proteobacteria bacterium]|nr:long-chain fatty acid--CoA ligase [Pseudomonadota bacterium]MBU1388838.1 long-chain fatty acid--CoA ligase [Pseudomonadota bacterium]MBU1542219.1 long-chain fatty acid--CoA ligase [Pseudomonadota bacterium]MBU2480409.1 long-chain fatty acid--CoA ligase [Pseudomonadota bacterium]